MKTASREKPDTNQLQYSLKTDTCHACPRPKSDSSAQLAWCCFVSFCTKYTQCAVGFYIIVLHLQLKSKKHDIKTILAEVSLFFKMSWELTLTYSDSVKMRRTHLRTLPWFQFKVWIKMRNLRKLSHCWVDQQRLLHYV